jgi:hypothetical protein
MFRVCTRDAYERFHKMFILFNFPCANQSGNLCFNCVFLFIYLFICCCCFVLFFYFFIFLFFFFWFGHIAVESYTKIHVDRNMHYMES